MTSKTEAREQGWLLLGHEIASQVQQAGEVWKAVSLKMCDRLPPGEDVERSDIKEAVEYVRRGVEEAGEKIRTGRLSSILLTGRRNYEYLTKPYPSWTAMEECGDNPKRFEWYEQYREKLTKRLARELHGTRKLDSPNAAMETYLQLMDEGDEEAVLEFLIKHPKIRAMHDRLTNRAYALDEDSRDARGGGGRDPEWDSGERLAAELERAHRNIRLRLQMVAENLGPSTPRGRIVTATNELIALLSMAEPMMTGITSVEQYLAEFPNEQEH